MPGQETKAEWFADLSASVAAVGAHHVAQLVVDPDTEAVVAVSPAFVELTGGAVPEHLDDLVQLGVLARPDLERQRRSAAAGRVAEAEVVDRWGETAHSWTDRVRLHRLGGTTLEVDLTIVVHARPKFPAVAVMVTVTPAREAVGPSSDADAATGSWLTVYDRELRVVASDQAFNPFSADPADMVGVLAAVLAHPEDLPEVLPPVLSVMRGEVAVSTYTVRLLAADGGWVLTHTELHRLAGGDGSVFVAVQRVVDEKRQVIPAGTLSRREQEVVAALFDGLRVAQLAERDAVSTNTVRTQLKSVYRKLEVAGQAELLARFHRPA